MASMKRIALILKKSPHPDLPEILRGFIPWLRSQGLTVVMARGSGCGTPEFPFDELPQQADVAIVLGGDGTMLGAARVMAPHCVPLVGVNLGGLGFITELYKEELEHTVGTILKGQCPSEDRIMLEAFLVRSGREVSRCLALNDVVITKGTTAKIVDLDCHVDSSFVSSFKADGIIVSTPTGSTAYSLAAGGPIMYPSLTSLVITPICPHMLTNRPIVLPADVQIEFTLMSDSADVMLTYDGIVSGQLEKGDVVVVRKSPHVTTLLMPCNRDHFHVLRKKLKWGAR